MSRMTVVVADGIPLQSMEYGSVVRTARGGETLYLVVCPMDGSGERTLVTLPTGTWKKFADQNMMVYPVDAVLTVARETP